MVTIHLPLVYFSLPPPPPLRLFYLFYFAVYLFKFKIAECDLCRRVKQGVRRVQTQPPSNPPRAKKLRLEITNFSEKLMGWGWEAGGAEILYKNRFSYAFWLCFRGHVPFCTIVFLVAVNFAKYGELQFV